MKYRKHLDQVERITAPHIEEGLIRLNSAERDLPIEETIWQKFIENLKETDVRYYPNVNNAVEKIAQHEGVKPSQITVGSGSDQIIRNIFFLIRFIYLVYFFSHNFFIILFFKSL